MRIAIIGAGSAGKAAALNLQSSGGYQVCLFSRGADEGVDNYCSLIDHTGATLQEGYIPTVIYDPEHSETLRSIRGYDVVLLCLPVYACVGVCRAIKPHISSDKRVYVGTIYGQGFFNTILKKKGGIFHDMPNVDTFSLAYIPWIVKLVGTDKVRATSTEHFNLSYTTADDKAPLLRLFEGLTSLNPIKPVIKFSGTEIEATLLSDNWLLHTPRLGGLLFLQRDPERGDVIPQFYGEYTPADYKILIRINREFEAMKKQLRKWAMENHGISLPHLYTFKEAEELPDINGNSEPFLGFENYFAADTTKGFRMSHTIEPDGWHVDMTHRMFRDDVINGLAIILSLCMKLGVKAMYMTSLYESLISAMAKCPIYSDLAKLQIEDWSQMSLDDYLLGSTELCPM